MWPTSKRRSDEKRPAALPLSSAAQPANQWSSKTNPTVSRIESDGGVHRFEPLVDEDALRQTHDAYEARRKAATLNTTAPQPSGGVGGTRTGIKCLHAHVANHLAGFVDPVGALVAEEMVLPELIIEQVR